MQVRVGVVLDSLPLSMAVAGRDRLHQGLYVNSKTDKLFDIADSPGYVTAMRKAGVDVTYVELPSNKGHMASHADSAMWAPILAAFMKSL